MTLNNPKQFHPKTYRCKFSHWVEETFFGRMHTKKIVENLYCFDLAEKISVVMHHGFLRFSL
jgi:hypothetical protein